MSHEGEKGEEKEAWGGQSDTGLDDHDVYVKFNAPLSTVPIRSFGGNETIVRADLVKRTHTMWDILLGKTLNMCEKAKRYNIHSGCIHQNKLMSLFVVF